MKRILLLSIYVITFQFLAQSQISRITVDPAFKPFYHGVASGDPQSDKVIIWTRVTPDSGDIGAVKINWQVATDMAFTNIVSYGYDFVNEDNDYTLKVDVCGLNPNRFYYFMFNALGRNSVIGRTKTAPSNSIDSIRFGIVSCSSYEDGYFNSYRDLVNRDDVDAVLHLGDYIYEYAASGVSATIPGRIEEPSNEIISLSDYRTRYSHYRLDSDLQRLHQVQPFITVWDDHETANNSYKDGAENHTPATEGPWSIRKSNGVKAYYEWLPLRRPALTDTVRIWRRVRYGNLVDLLMVDSRLYARDLQDNARRNDTTHRLLGRTQLDWLKAGLSDNFTKYKLIGNQVMFAPLTVFGAPVNSDQWDGYATERAEIQNHLRSNNLKNAVVLTGDIHTSWANDVPGSGYNSSTGANSDAVEFVCTSVTSGNSPISIPSGIISTANPHMKFIDLVSHGYLLVDVNRNRVQTDYMFLSTITSKTFTSSRAKSFTKLDGQSFIKETSTGLYARRNTVMIPPVNPDLTANVAKITDTITAVTLQNTSKVVLVYPNTFGCNTITSSIISSTSYGSSTLTGPSLNYTPSTNYSGYDTAIIEVCQSSPLICDTVVVIIQVRPVVQRSYVFLSVKQDSTITYCGSFDDLYSGVTSGYLYYAGSNGIVNFFSDSCISYKASSTFLGKDTVVIVGCDSSTAVKCDTLFLIITTKPLISKEVVSLTISSDSTLRYCKGFDDVAPPYATVSILHSGVNGLAQLLSDTCIKYIPSISFSGYDTIYVIACAPGTPLKCDTIQYIIRVNTPNSTLDQDELIVFGINPNPFFDELVVQYYLKNETSLKLILTNETGQEIFHKSYNVMAGINYAKISGLSLPSGVYVLRLLTGKDFYSKKIIKQ